jgi:predicted DNA-binding protein (MmcQ/YjbR family)
MNIESYRSYCLSKKGVTEEFPFGEETIVFKVMGKMFTLSDVTEFGSVNLKCDPEAGAELQEKFPSVQPGYQMNKKHWITVVVDGSVSDKLFQAWIDASYDLVVKGLSKREKSTLDAL